MPEVKEKTLLDELIAKRDAAFEVLDTLLTERATASLAAEKRIAEMPRTDDTERAAVAVARKAEDALNAEYELRRLEYLEDHEDWDRRVKDQENLAEARAAAAKAHAEAEERGAGGAVVTKAPMTYERHNAHNISYYRDLAAALVPGSSFQGTDSAQSLARLQRHAAELDVEMPARAKAREERARKQVAEAEAKNGSRGVSADTLFHRGQVHNPFEQRVTPNLTPGAGGYFSPPLWLPDEYIPYLRAHRVASGLPRQMDLPAGTDSINVPKLSTGTTVGYQQANNTGLPSQDWADTYVQANVKTMGGYSDVAIQLLEQSPGHIVDEVITTDLMAAYDLFLDQQVLNGDGVGTTALNGGHIQGLYSSAGASAWTSYNGVTYTDGSPAGWKFPSVFAAMASKIANSRYSQENLKFILHPSRWFAYSSSVDANDRPLGETDAGGRFNIAAAQMAGLQSEGLVGTLPSVANAPVYIDANVTLTDTAGGGSAQDIALAALWDDVWLFQGELRTDVFREILSGTLGVRFRVYAYNAMLVRYGQSLAIASGSGFAAPTGAVSSITYR